jgi:hypothetical protein
MVDGESGNNAAVNLRDVARVGAQAVEDRTTLRHKSPRNRVQEQARFCRLVYAVGRWVVIITIPIKWIVYILLDA